MSLIEGEVDKLDFSDQEKKEIKEVLAVLPTPGLQTLYKALQLGPLHTRTFVDSYKRKKDILARKDMKAWRKLIGDEINQVVALI